eukprot:g57123.t1
MWRPLGNTLTKPFPEKELGPLEILEASFQSISLTMSCDFCGNPFIQAEKKTTESHLDITYGEKKEDKLEQQSQTSSSSGSSSRSPSAPPNTQPPKLPTRGIGTMNEEEDSLGINEEGEGDETAALTQDQNTSASLANKRGSKQARRQANAASSSANLANSSSSSSSSSSPSSSSPTLLPNNANIANQTIASHEQPTPTVRTPQNVLGAQLDINIQHALLSVLANIPAFSNLLTQAQEAVATTATSTQANTTQTSTTQSNNGADCNTSATTATNQTPENAANSSSSSSSSSSTGSDSQTKSPNSTEPKKKMEDPIQPADAANDPSKHQLQIPPDPVANVPENK